MPRGISYKDIEDRDEGRSLLESKRAEDKSLSIMNAQMFEQEEALGAEEQELNQGHADMDDRELMATAQEVIANMEVMSQQGRDPMELLSQLPPEVQDAVTQLLNQEEGSQDPQQPQQQSPEQDLQQLQQQPINITEQSKRLL